MRNLVLIGMPTSGKSTVGVILAKELGMSFTDTDLLLQNHCGMKLCDLISREGMDAFLAAEEQICCVLSEENTVIATGGSVVYSEAAMEHLRAGGTVIYLKIGSDELKARLKDARQRGVVLREGQSIDELFEERAVLYERWADVTVSENGLSLEETVRAAVSSVAEDFGFIKSEAGI